MFHLDELEKDYFRKVASLYPLTDEDLALIQEVRILARIYCERGSHQLVSLAIGYKQPYLGLQFDFNPGQSNECAEQDAAKQAERNQDRLRKIVTARLAPDGTIHLVWPCGNCRIWLYSLFGKDIQVIVPFNDEDCKFPMQVLYPYCYSPRVRPLPEEISRAAVALQEYGRRPIEIPQSEQEWLRSERDRFERARREKPLEPSRFVEPEESKTDDEK